MADVTEAGFGRASKLNALPQASSSQTRLPDQDGS